MSDRDVLRFAEQAAGSEWPLVRAFIRRGCELAAEREPALTIAGHAQRAQERARNAGDLETAAVIRAAFIGEAVHA